MNAHAPVLDVEKLRKVVALMLGGSSDGERASARGRAEVIAAKAGLSLDAALVIMDRQKPASAPGSIFDGFDDWMEQKEPGYKSKRAAEQAVREAERHAKLQAFIEEFGSEEAILAETERERLLQEALAPLADWKKYSNVDRTYMDGYAGWTCRNPPPAVWDALRNAYAFPEDLAGVWEEFKHWERLADARYTVDPYSEHPVWVRARTAALEHLLDTMPAPSFDAFAVRLQWLSHLNKWEIRRDREEDQLVIDAMVADLESLRRAQPLQEDLGIFRGMSQKTKKRTPRPDPRQTELPL